MNKVKYVLITAAYNEAELIKGTIKSVIKQVLLPSLWIIVDDGSTDDTNNIVKKYTKQYPFIKLLLRKKASGRDFASKVFAINYGLRGIDLKEFDFLGILDADVSFESDYYSSLIEKFKVRPKLGITGGKYFDLFNGKKHQVYPSPFSVRGATQFFRRECFEKIGGLLPLKFGGEDGVACIAARMFGWEVCNFEELEVLHYRRTGTSNTNIIKVRFRDGLVEYSLGYHPIFQFVKSVSRMVRERPYLVGGFFRLLGFWWANFKREERLIPKDILKYTRKEQIHRIFRLTY